MSIKPAHLRELISDTLDQIGLNSESAVELLMLTAAQESHCGRYLKQIGGPAMGIFQMEPNTLNDLHFNFLVYQSKLQSKLRPFTAGICSDNFEIHLQGNLPYQIVMARMHYYRFSEPLPPATQVTELARYWKTYWNTKLGKGTVTEAVDNYARYAVKSG